MKEIKQYVLLSPELGDTILDASSWEEVIMALYLGGYERIGEVRVVERIYHLVCETPHIFNTDLFEANNEQ